MRTPFGIRLITTFGLGYMRPASGTWGSLPPALVAVALVVLAPGNTAAWFAVHAAFIVVFSLGCILGGDEAEARFGEKDPGEAVADETAGMGVTMIALPWMMGGRWDALGQAASVWHAIVLIAVAFVAFRVMDIIKPPPAYQLQKIPGGWGILIDDLAAGVYAALVLWGVAAWW